MKDAYTIQDLCLITGLTDRTLRNHLALGNLEGEKVGSAWQFTPQQVEAFLRLPQVRPVILAKKNAIVYDFLLTKSKKTRKMCVILDLPGEDGKEISSYFCRQISARTSPAEKLTFSSEDTGGCPRVILRGGADDVMALLEEFSRK